MGKILILIAVVFLFFSCDKEKKATPAKPKRSMLHLLPYDKAKKLVGKYTGRHDSSMYLHRWIMELDGDKVDENVIVSEMLSDPQPLVSVYFKKKDTLVFIPVPAVCGTIPEVEELFLKKGTIARLGIRYVSRGPDGSYNYNFPAYTFSDQKPYPLFTFCLATISPDGTILNPKTIEFEAIDQNGILIKLFEANVIPDRTETYMNKGPVLIKKYAESTEEYVSKWYPGNEVQKPYDRFYLTKGKGAYKMSSIKPDDK